MSMFLLSLFLHRLEKKKKHKSNEHQFLWGLTAGESTSEGPGPSLGWEPISWAQLTLVQNGFIQ